MACAQQGGLPARGPLLPSFSGTGSLDQDLSRAWPVWLCGESMSTLKPIMFFHLKEKTHLSHQGCFSAVWPTPALGMLTAASSLSACDLHGTRGECDPGTLPPPDSSGASPGRTTVLLSPDCTIVISAVHRLQHPPQRARPSTPTDIPRTPRAPGFLPAGPLQTLGQALRLRSTWGRTPRSRTGCQRRKQLGTRELNFET